MMKRILSLMMILMLLCALPGHAESDPYAMVQEALYRIVLRTETEDVTLGSAVLFLQENVLLTAAGCCRDGDLYAIGADGEHAIRDWEVMDESGVALMEMATASSAAPLVLSTYDVPSLPYIFGADAGGNTGAAPLYQALYAIYRGQNAMTLSCVEGILPGAVMVDETGRIIGLVVAQQMEGDGMYIALEPDSLYTALVGDLTADAFLPLEVKWADGLLEISWQDRVRESGVYLIHFSGAENNYYTTYEAEHGERSVYLAVPPGHTYYMQVQWAESEETAQDLLWGAMTTYTVPKTVFTQYGFRQDCYLSAAPSGQEITGLLPEMDRITADTLSDAANDLYLQIINSYDVSDEVEMPMTVSLTAPDGQFYYEIMNYIFSPEYEEDDTFAVPVDDLFASCRDFSGSGTFRPGDYVLSYTIGGRVAGEYAFTVE